MAGVCIEEGEDGGGNGDGRVLLGIFVLDLRIFVAFDHGSLRNIYE